MRSRTFSAEQIRLTVWSGMLIGLLAVQAAGYLPALESIPELPSAAAADPYAEARRSRAILEAQEGRPPALAATRGSATGALRAGGPVRVIDGDTFDHGADRIRIADIDAPEVEGRCPEEIALAARATARTRQLLARGPFELHTLPSGRDEDRYGRKLRIVTRGGRSIGDVLVAEGLARTWTGRREGWCG